MKKIQVVLDRRKLLKLGLSGAASAALSGGVVSKLAASFSPAVPLKTFEPVYRTLGRTGLKITVVSFGAMLTP